MEKRRREEAEEEEEVNSPDVKKLKESLLENLDDDETTTELCNQDLATFMKTFEDEITSMPSNELGFLLEASDDELGLPPPVPRAAEPETEPAPVESEPPGSDFWDEPPTAGYDEFDRFGFGIEPDVAYGGEEDESYVALDGLFDYSDMGFGSGDVLWKPEFETLPAQ